MQILYVPNHDQRSQGAARKAPPANTGMKKERRKVGRWSEEESNALVDYVERVRGCRCG